MQPIEAADLVDPGAQSLPEWSILNPALFLLYLFLPIYFSICVQILSFLTMNVDRLLTSIFKTPAIWDKNKLL